MDSFDFDTSADGDLDINFGDALIWMNSALSFFNLGKVPLMIILSFFSLTLWCFSILANFYLNNSSVLLAIIYLVPGIIVSAFVTKFITAPFVKLFRKAADTIETNQSLTGKLCTVTLEADNIKFGQAEIKMDGTSIIINVLSTEAEMHLHKGETCLVIDYMPERKIYLIEPYKN